MFNRPRRWLAAKTTNATGVLRTTDENIFDAFIKVMFGTIPG